jgi:hypothetical protein
MEIFTCKSSSFEGVITFIKCYLTIVRKVAHAEEIHDGINYIITSLLSSNVTYKVFHACLFNQIPIGKIKALICNGFCDYYYRFPTKFNLEGRELVL